MIPDGITPIIGYRQFNEPSTGGVFHSGVPALGEMAWKIGETNKFSCPGVGVIDCGPGTIATSSGPHEAPSEDVCVTYIYTDETGIQPLPLCWRQVLREPGPYPWGYGCGLYAYKEFEDAKGVDIPGKWWLVGEVELWGTVREHEKGYRAEYAKLTKIVYDPRAEFRRRCDMILRGGPGDT